MTSWFVGHRSTAGRSQSGTSAALAADNDRLRVQLAAARAALETAEARERARIADDLHDILGRALEVVAFKAELADRLLGTDISRARSEMTDVQRVARCAMSEVRNLARSRRPTNLDDELAGATSLFDSAGVEVTVFGNGRTLIPSARDPLARTLREAVTNVLRHAVPTRCHIAIEQNCGEASITVINDGANAAAAPLSSGGTGLVGLSRLLAEHGGLLSAHHDGFGLFTLRATVATAAPTPGGAVPGQVLHVRRSPAELLAVPQ